MPRTGPKTPEGKAKSSQNALKHGLTSNRMYIFGNENPVAWDETVQSWVDRLQPRGAAEYMIVHDIAHAHWQLRRARRWESGMVDVEMEEQRADMEQIYTQPMDEGTRLAHAYKGLADNSKALDAFLRYERAARRAYRQGIAALTQLRASAPAYGPPAAAPAPELPQPEPASQPEPQPEPEPEISLDPTQPEPEPEPAPEPNAVEPEAETAEHQTGDPADEEILPAAVRDPAMPRRLRDEWNHLRKTIPKFDYYWHYDRMSPELQKWVNKKAA